MKNILPVVAASVLMSVAAVAAPAGDSRTGVVPAVEPSGDQRTSPDAPGEAIPGTSVRPEGMDQSNVPKTPLDRKKATTADVGASTTDQNKPPLAPDDRAFLEMAHQTDKAEMSAGEMAAQRAQKTDVKAYGAMMMKDHQQSHSALMSLAQSNGVSLPDAPDAEHVAVAGRLKAAQGADFDRVFMDEMVKGHRKAIATYERASRESKDAEIKAHADKTLPTLRKHSAQAERVQGAMNGKKAAAAG